MPNTTTAGVLYDAFVAQMCHLEGESLDETVDELVNVKKKKQM